MKRLNIILVGDGAVGKTPICIAYTTGVFPDYVPSVSEHYSAFTTVDGLDYELTLTELSGLDDYARLRALHYDANTDLIIICFSLVNRKSFTNVTEKWIPEVRQYLPDANILLVGTKSDLRRDQSNLKSGRQRSEEPIKHDEGRQLSKMIKAERYMECSALTMEGINDLFSEAIRIIMNKSEKESTAESCTIS
ncbi:unnamed protein product [Clavelina lepadiformis]|uniref:Uncharacterized protein n=1 Tax=Clavelina lepadiformis TaxID=159417 RepID=A0ABP0F174_CLALP